MKAQLATAMKEILNLSMLENDSYGQVIELGKRFGKRLEEREVIVEVFCWMLRDLEKKLIYTCTIEGPSKSRAAIETYA